MNGKEPAARPRRVLLLGNARARHGGRARGLIGPLGGLGLDVAYEEPDGLERLDHVIRAIGPGMDRIVIAGGDGSIAAALPALIAVKTPLAIIPFGTANDLARNLALPEALDAQLRLVADGRVVPIDLGSANGRPFLNAASLGLGAAVAALHQGWSKKLLGVLNYPRLLYLAYRRVRPFTTIITCDGEIRRDRFVHLAIVNGRFHGGGLEPWPSSTITDGLLDLYALRDGPAFRLMRLLASLRIRGMASDAVFRLRGRAFRIETSRPRRVNIDGEIVAETPLDIELMPRALPVVVPASFEPAMPKPAMAGPATAGDIAVTPPF